MLQKTKQLLSKNKNKIKIKRKKKKSSRYGSWQSGPFVQQHQKKRKWRFAETNF